MSFPFPANGQVTERHRTTHPGNEKRFACWLQPVYWGELVLYVATTRVPYSPYLSNSTRF